MTNLAPIVLFVYNRPWHTLKTLESLQLNKLADKSQLYIFADGPAEGASEETLQAIEETRKALSDKQWCGKVHVIARETNLGLANNVIAGITQVINEHGKIIVLEDDLITSPYFLTYCNDGLELYKNEKQVYSINGFQFPLKLSKTDAFLSPLATSSWGWATWKDRWTVFEEMPKGIDVIKANKHIRRRFNFGDYNYVGMLGNEKSWAIRWYYSVFLRNGLGLFPTKSLVNNIGFDGSGENCEDIDFKQHVFLEKIILQKKDAIDLTYYDETVRYFNKKPTQNESKKQTSSSLVKRLVKRILKKFT